MFTDQNETKDWLFGIAVVVVIIAAFLLIRHHQVEQHEAEQAAALAIPPPERKTTHVIEYRQSSEASEPMRVAPKSVYRCVVNGQQVFSDQACATNASVIEITEPNRADPQDTTHLYDAGTGQRSRVTSRSGSFSDSGSAASLDGRATLCDSIQQQIDSINARMRSRYSNWEGERFRDRLRELKAEQWDEKCRWVKRAE